MGILHRKKILAASGIHIFNYGTFHQKVSLSLAKLRKSVGVLIKLCSQKSIGNIFRKETSI